MGFGRVSGIRIAVVFTMLAPALAWAVNEDPSGARAWHDAIAYAPAAPCRSNAACAAAGVAALAHARTDDAQKIVDTELRLAIADFLMADTPAREDAGNARVAMALVHEGDVAAQRHRYSAARAEYDFALERREYGVGDRGPSTRRVLDVAASRLRDIAARDVAAPLPPGGAVYSRMTWIGMTDDVSIKPVAGRPGVYAVSSEFTYPVLADDGQFVPNLGDLSATVRFFDGVGRIPMNQDDDVPVDATRAIADVSHFDKPDRCLLELRLDAPETLTIKTIGAQASCGFGANVVADGIYRFTGTLRP